MADQPMTAARMAEKRSRWERLRAEHAEWRANARSRKPARWEDVADLLTELRAAQQEIAALRGKVDMQCPHAKPGDGFEYEPCGCSGAADGHCMNCCRPFEEHAMSDRMKAAGRELIRRAALAPRPSGEQK